MICGINKKTSVPHNQCGCRDERDNPSRYHSTSQDQKMPCASCRAHNGATRFLLPSIFHTALTKRTPRPVQRIFLLSRTVRQLSGQKQSFYFFSSTSVKSLKFLYYCIVRPFFCQAQSRKEDRLPAIRIQNSKNGSRETPESRFCADRTAAEWKMSLTRLAAAGACTSTHSFLSYRKLRFHTIKMLREDAHSAQG